MHAGQALTLRADAEQRASTVGPDGRATKVVATHGARCRAGRFGARA